MPVSIAISNGYNEESLDNPDIPRGLAPAAKAQEFNEEMVRFYLTRDGMEMMLLLVGCHPEADEISRRSLARPSEHGPTPS